MKDKRKIALLALLGFLAFKGFKKAKAKTPAGPKEKVSDLFTIKVKALQKFLKVKVDGIPAGETNGALKKQFGLPYGNVKPENIDQYLNDLHIRKLF